MEDWKSGSTESLTLNLKPSTVLPTEYRISREKVGQLPTANCQLPTKKYMIKNYIITALRNLRKNKAHSFINICGTVSRYGRGDADWLVDLE